MSRPVVREFFRQNEELTYVPDDYAAENYFLTKEPDTEELPVYEDIKDRLPVPIWENHQDCIDCYNKAWQIGFRNLRKSLPGTGMVSHYIDTAFNDALFMWDSCFILMFGKYADRIFPFQKTLDNFYASQHKDGFICRVLMEDTGRDRFTRYDPSATGPDIMAWCEWEYYHNFGDKERLARVFPPLMAYHRWMRLNHTWPDGTYFSSGWGCGMDNMPRLMPGYSILFSHGHMVWVDACMQELNNCNILAQMAQVLGREEAVPELLAERDRLEKVINEKLWDEESGFYYDLWNTGELNMVRHIGAYWALLAKCAPAERAKRMLVHLQDEKIFKTATRVPSLSKEHPHFSAEGTYWKGSVWAPTNYMVLKGLDSYGEYELAHEIGSEYLHTVVEVFKERGTVFENYAPENINDGKPDKGNRSAGDFVGWTGLAPISVLFEYVFGIKPDAGSRRILWDVNLLERHGVERYPFGVDGEMTLLCQARSSAAEKPEITVESNVPVTLEIRYGEAGHKKTYVLEVEGTGKK